MGLFEKFKQGLKKTAQLLNTDIRDIFKGQGRLVDEAFLEAWFETLVRTDMGVEASKELVAEIRAEFPRPGRRRGADSRVSQGKTESRCSPSPPRRFVSPRPARRSSWWPA